MAVDRCRHAGSRLPRSRRFATSTQSCGHRHMRQGSTAQHGRCAEVLTVSHYGEQHTHHAEVMTGSNPEASHSTSRHLWLLAVESLQSGDRMRTRSRPVRCRPVVGAVVASLAETHAEAPADVQLRGPALGRRPWMRSRRPWRPSRAAHPRCTPLPGHALVRRPRRSCVQPARRICVRRARGRGSPGRPAAAVRSDTSGRRAAGWADTGR